VRPLRLTAIACAVLCVFAGCGGKEEPTRRDDVVPDPVSVPDVTVPGFPAPEGDFHEIDATVRFVNLYSTGGEGQDIDFRWGAGFGPTVDAVTLGYGEISDPIAAQVDANGFTDTVSWSEWEPGAADVEGSEPLSTDDENLVDGESILVVLGAERADPDTDPNIFSSQIVFVEGSDSNVTEPPSGQAVVYLVSAGTNQLDESFYVLGEPDACLSSDNDLGGGNAGTGSVIDSGPHDLGAYVANTDCAADAETVAVDAQAGHRYIAFSYGTTAENVTLLLIDLD
jgi:hypothetical protein